MDKGACGWFVSSPLPPLSSSLLSSPHLFISSQPLSITYFIPQTAIIYEADEPSDSKSLTYSDLLSEVCKLSNVLRTKFGIKKGDTVSIYLPMTYHALIAFLACARIGAVHSVVFAGFSAESLRDRVRDCACRVLITSDEGKRGGKTIATKAIVDAALEECPLVEHVLVLERTGKGVSMKEGRDRWWHEEIKTVGAYCTPEIMGAEDPLFVLYVRSFPSHPLSN